MQDTARQLFQNQSPEQRLCTGWTSLAKQERVAMDQTQHVGAQQSIAVVDGRLFETIQSRRRVVL